MAHDDEKHTRRRTGNVVRFPARKAHTVRAGLLPPPGFLSPSATDIWYSIVESLPSDRFDAASGQLLAIYCRTVATQNRLAIDVDRFERRKRFDSIQFRAYCEALGRANRNIQLMASMATKLRLTQQTTMRADAAGAKCRRSGPVKKPWDME
jgi:hypothetical protein